MIDLPLDPDERDALVILADRLIWHRGEVRANDLTDVQVRAIYRLRHRGFITYRTLKWKPSDATRNPEVTHGVQFSEAAWDLLFAMLRRKAEEHTPTFYSTNAEVMRARWPARDAVDANGC